MFKSGGIANLLKQRLMNSPTLSKIINNMFNTMKSKRQVFSYRRVLVDFSSNNFFKTDGDLHLAIGHAYFNITIVKGTVNRRTRYRVTVKVSDIYDFDFLDKNNKTNKAVKVLNNAIGFYPQKKELFIHIIGHMSILITFSKYES